MSEPARAPSAQGIGLLPEDRKTEGCFLPQSVAFNVTISRLDELRKRWRPQPRAGARASSASSSAASISAHPDIAHARRISCRGGNQQKCMIARSLNARCAILLIDEPTRGVDVGAKREIYQLLARLADDERAAIVMVSSELPEILGLSDRIVVMRDGRIAGRFERGEASEEALMAAAVGARDRAAQRRSRAHELRSKKATDDRRLSTIALGCNACGGSTTHRTSGLIWVLVVDVRRRGDHLATRFSIPSISSTSCARSRSSASSRSA